MKKFFKRNRTVLAIFLAIIMLFCLIPTKFSVKAAEVSASPISITANGEALDVTSLGERDYISGVWKDPCKKPMYSVKIPENTDFVIAPAEAGDGAAGTTRNFFLATGESMQGSYPYTMTASNLEYYVLNAEDFEYRVGTETGIDTSNKAAFIEVRDTDLNRLYVILVEVISSGKEDGGEDTEIITSVISAETLSGTALRVYQQGTENVRGEDVPVLYIEIPAGTSYVNVIPSEDYKVYDDIGSWEETASNLSVVPMFGDWYTLTKDYGQTLEYVIKFVEEAPVSKIGSEKVYLSVSYDGAYVVGAETGEVIAFKEIEVPYFDLEPYGLEKFDSNKTEEVTILHLFLYATEVYYCGVDIKDAGKGYLYEEEILGTNVLTISGEPGSVFMNEFWNMGLNLNYYLNYEYPMESEGWGATADRIILEDGDIVTVGGFTSWDFYNDSTSVFNYIKANEDIIKISAKQGELVELSLYYAGSGEGDGTAHTPVATSPNVYYTLRNTVSDGNVKNWKSFGKANETGKITVDTRKLAPGEYLIAMEGQYGKEYTDVICSAPGGIILTITEGDAPIVPPVEETGVVRISGTTRYETGYKVADTLKETLGVDKFEAVVVATGKNFADALVGSYLAVNKNAPIILTNGKADNIAALHAYIAENVAAGGKVYILGGEGAVPAEAAAIDGYDVVRLSGKSRYETNLAILAEAGVAGDSVIVATGKTFADSLSASAAKLPILLVKPDTALTEEAKAVLAGMKKIYIIGGTGAVSEGIEAELAAYGDVTRISGKSRYETSVAAAETFFGTVENAVAASGKNFPDGLCGGPLAAAMNAPLILTADAKTDAAAGYMVAHEIASGYVLGGTGALSDESVVDIFALESADEII